MLKICVGLTIYLLALDGLICAANAATRVPLGVRERSGVERSAEPVTSGVPIPKGALTDVKQIRLLKGRREIPAQFRVTGHWAPSKDIRWVLVDTQVDLAAKGTQEYALEYGEGVRARARLRNAVKITEDEDAYTVETGAATFRVSRRRFSIFEEVKLGRRKIVVAAPADDKDTRGGVIKGLKPMVTRTIPAPGNKGRAHLIYVRNGGKATQENWTLRFTSDRAFEVKGEKAGAVGTGEYRKDFSSTGGEMSIPGRAWLNYAAPKQGDVITFTTIPGGASARSEGVFESKVIEEGPLRSVIMLKGSFGPASAPVMEYTAWYHFHAESARVRLEFTLENNNHGGRTATGNASNCNIGGVNCVFFDEMSLALPLAAEGKKTFSLLGEAGSEVVTGELDSAAELYQDSNGGPKWNRYKNPRFNPRPNSYVTFKGYRVEKGGERLAEGGRAVGWLDVSGPGAGLTTTVRDFLQNFPKALAASADGTVEVKLFPGRYAGDFPFRSGEHKTHSVLFLFHGGDARKAGARETALAFSDPLRLEPSPEWFARTRVLDRTHPYDTENYKAYEVRNLSAVGIYPEGAKAGPSILSRREQHDLYGWMDYGDVSMDFEGGTGQWGMKYDLDLQMARQWARTGRDEWWRLFVAGDRHAADIDVHHQPHYPEVHYVKGGVWAHSLHNEAGHRNPNRNRNHFTKDLCFGARGTAVLYHLTGNWKARASCLEIAENALARYMSPQAKPDPKKSNRLGSRGDACTLNRLLDGWLLSGDEKLLERARWQIGSRAFDGKPAKHGRTSLWSSVFYMMALMRYIEMFPEDEAARGYYLAHAETLRKGTHPQNGIYYHLTPKPDGSVTGKGTVSHYNIMASDALAHAYLLTKETKFMDAARICFAYGVKNACWTNGPPTYTQVHSGNGATHGNVFMTVEQELKGK